MNDLHTGISCLCVGAANIDIRCAFDRISRKATSNIGEISIMVGGAALNTARIIASHNIETTLTGPIGEEKNQITVETALEDADVNNALVTVDGAATGCYVSMLEPDGSLKLACNDMRIHQMFDSDLARTVIKPLLNNKPNAVFYDTNIPQQSIEAIRDMTPGTGHYATTVSPAKAGRLRSVLDRLDILFTNKEEAKALLDVPGASIPVENLVKRLAESRSKCGIISNGADPLWYWHDGSIEQIDPPKIPDIIDVTGAGDALAGGTIAGMMHGMEIKEAIMQGIKMAGMVLRVKGPYPF